MPRRLSLLGRNGVCAQHRPLYRWVEALARQCDQDARHALYRLPPCRPHRAFPRSYSGRPHGLPWRSQLGSYHRPSRCRSPAVLNPLTRASTLPARKMELLRCIVEIGAELSRQAESIAKLITSKPTASADTSGGGVLSEADIMSQL